MSTAVSTPAGERLPVRFQLQIFGGALILRSVFVLAQQRWSVFFGGNFDGPDTRVYLDLAHSLVSGLGFSSPGPVGWKESGYPFAVGPTAWVMPGYPLFLAGCRTLFGDGTLSIKLAQCVLGALACVFIARTAAALFGRGSGWIAGLTAAIYYELVFSANGLLTESLYVCLVAWMLSAFVAAGLRSTRITTSYAFAGLTFGTAALVRPQALGAAMCLTCVMAARAAFRSSAVELRRAIVFGAASVTVLVPWAIRNEIVLDRFDLISTESGYVFWLGNNEGYDRIASDFSRFGGYSPAGIFKPLSQTRGRPEVEVDRIYTAAAADHIARYPWRWAARAPHKLWNMWRPTEVTSSTRHQIVTWVLYPTLLIASVFGLNLSWRQQAPWPLRVYLFANIGLHAAVTGELRFRQAFWPALIPFAGLGLSRAIEFTRITILGARVRSSRERRLI